MKEDEEEPERIESHKIVIPNEIVTPGSSSLRKKRRWKLCCACTSMLILIAGIILMILFLTVFKIKKPKIKLRNVSLKGLEDVNPFRLLPTTNLTLLGDVSVKNPNIGSFKFKNGGTTEVFYRKVQVVDAQIPPGNAEAKKTTHINVTMDFMLRKIVYVSGLVGDLMAGSLPLDTKTRIKGKVDIIGIVKKTVAVELDCSLRFFLVNQTVRDQKCNSTVKL